MRVCLLGLLTACAVDAAPSTLEVIGDIEGRFSITDEAVWFSPGDGALWRLDLATGERTRTSQIDPTATNLTVLDDRAYWARLDDDFCGSVWRSEGDRVAEVLAGDACWNLVGGVDQRLVVSMRKRDATTFDDTTIATFDLETGELVPLRTLFSRAEIKLVEHRLGVIDSGVARIFDLRSGGVVEIALPRAPPFFIVPTEDSIGWIENGSLFEVHPDGDPREVATLSIFARELARIDGQWIAIEDRSSLERGDRSVDLLRIDDGGRINEWPLHGEARTSLVHGGAYWFTTGTTLQRYGRPL